jgi:dihydrofolate reductase
MALHLIFARAANGVIGRNNALPWHLPEDLAHFKRLTLGCPVIMGRKTWDSLPPRFRPLPGRRNVVVTRQPDWQAEGVLRAHSLPEALQQCQDEADVWVIGGAELYAQALPLAASAQVTEIDAPFEGDAYAPELDASWVETARLPQVSTGGLHFSFVTYRKRPEAA